MTKHWKEDINGINTLTPANWCAYDNLKGCQSACKRVNASLFNAITWARKKISSDEFADPVKVGQGCYHRVNKVLSNTSKWGFNDTEGQVALCEFIEEWLELHDGAVNRW